MDSAQDRKDRILEYLHQQKLCVISTTNAQGTSQSAVVAFAETEALEIIFGTFCTTRKYNNLKNNAQVSIVIGWDDDEAITIQYEGKAEELTGNNIEQYKQLQITKNPSSANYANHPNQRYFKITPTWIRYSDLSKDEEEIFEIEL